VETRGDGKPSPYRSVAGEGDRSPLQDHRRGRRKRGDGAGTINSALDTVWFNLG